MTDTPSFDEVNLDGYVHTKPLPLEDELDDAECHNCGQPWNGGDGWDERHSSAGVSIGEEWLYTCPRCGEETFRVWDMANTRTVRVGDEPALDAKRDELERDGYRVVAESRAAVTLQTRDHGSLAWHLFVFVATFWWTAGLGNLCYALYRRYESLDRVRIRAVTTQN